MHVGYSPSLLPNKIHNLIRIALTKQIFKYPLTYKYNIRILISLVFKIQEIVL
jgi:hypothetical protein